MVVFVETPVFTRRVQEHLGDDEYAALQGSSLNARIRERSLNIRAGFANCDGPAAAEVNAAGCG